jgi:chemotaxis protein MotB
MLRKAILAVLAAALTLGVSACTVMQGTYQQKVNEADTLARRYAALQKQYDDLSAENAELKSRGERLAADLAGMTQQKEKVDTDLAYMTGQRDKLSQDREELNDILRSRTDSLSQNVFELRKKVADLEEENTALRRENARLARAKEEQVQKVSSTYENLLEKMKVEIAQGQVTISELKGKLSVNLVDAILFDSGKAEVKKGGLTVLRKVVGILKDVKDKSIRIEGYTDNVPIAGSLAKRFPSNWELSAARAINVTRYLQEQGIDPAQLSAVAHGEWSPVADNATPEGRAKNRRIEINLVERE